MGEVFLAEALASGRQIALKGLPESFALDKEWLVQFEREVFAVSALNHPNILTIHEFDSSGIFQVIAWLMSKKPTERILLRLAFPIYKAN